ncbi:DNA-binding GntR family transcriptional regulator [Chelatococcus caeni]|uniref:DNA-binding GntR family transcriptional regulator n=3 Tax=Chelatococcus caeni TaxID=1348468 RepID=A0A840C3Z9_9HYPH|nr:DNA-binding GntR family transcriptional regulator [Chelatococcus caeni]
MSMTDETIAPSADRPEAGPEEARPIARRTLHDEVVTRIRDMITEGQLAPGARVHEGQLGAALGISRTPLREALKFLAREGLIELVPSRGAIVRRFSPKDVYDMLSVLATLEAEAGRLACANASDADIAAVAGLHARMMAFYASRNRLEYFKLNQAIHTAIVRLSGNAVLADIHETLQSRLKRIRFLGNQEPPKWDEAVAEHEEMITALTARDPDRLAKILANHMRNSWERVRQTLP